MKMYDGGYCLSEQPGVNQLDCLLPHSPGILLNHRVQPFRIQASQTERIKGNNSDGVVLWPGSERRKDSNERVPRERDNHIKIWIGIERIYSRLAFVCSVKRPESLVNDMDPRVILSKKLLKGPGTNHNSGDVWIDTEKGHGSMALQKAGDSLRGNLAALCVIVEDIEKTPAGWNCEWGTNDHCRDTERESAIHRRNKSQTLIWSQNQSLVVPVHDLID